MRMIKHVALLSLSSVHAILLLLVILSFQIGFIGVRGDGYSGDIGLDDLSLNPNECESDVYI